MEKKIFIYSIENRLLKTKQEKQIIFSKKWLIFINENAVYKQEFGSFGREMEGPGMVSEALVEISRNLVGNLSVSESKNSALSRDLFFKTCLGEITKGECITVFYYLHSFKIYICACIYIYIYIYTHTCMCVYICMCMKFLTPWTSQTGHNVKTSDFFHSIFCHF